MIAEAEAIKTAHKDAFNQDYEIEGFDFTGKAVKCHWRKDEKQVTADLVFTSGAGGGIIIQQISTSLAILKFSKTTAQMADVAVGTYQYDIEAVDGAGNAFTLCYGTVKVLKKYTF